MISSQMTLRLLAASLLLSGVAFAGAAMAKPTGEAAPQKVAVAITTVSASDSVASTSALAPAQAVVSEASPACARKVKVIYAGYGEAARASCIVSSSAAAD